MGYLITRIGRNNEALLLVDRGITKKQWWTTNRSKAIHFQNLSAAKIQLSKLMYGNPKIIYSDNYCEFNMTNIEDDFHPLDSYCLGQE